MNFRFPSIDSLSFWIGFILATLFWWIITALKPVFQQMRERIRATRAEVKKKTRTTTAILEEHYCQMVLKQAQSLHLAASLFSLDEIIMPPAFLAPPPRIEPGGMQFMEDLVYQTIPYLPTWPEIAAIYKAQTLTFKDVLSVRTKLVLLGQPGSGKTIALANLASQIAKRDPDSGLPVHTLPILVHVADLELPLKNPQSPLSPIINTIAKRMPVFDLPRLPDFIQGAFNEKRTCLLLDGLDELTQTGVDIAIDYLSTILQTYPQTIVITTASPEYFGGLITQEFLPLTLTAWNQGRCQEFLEKWERLWTRYVEGETWLNSSPEPIETLLLTCWLEFESKHLTPLELTLKVWGAFAGDSRGPLPMNAIETHLRRLFPSDAPPEAVELLALKVNQAMEPIFDVHKAKEWIQAFDPQEDEQEPAQDDQNNTKKEDRAPVKSSIISKMVTSGLLVHHMDNRMRFLHPVFFGHLAGKALVRHPEENILPQQPWSGKTIALHYFAAYGDASKLVEIIISETTRPLFRELLSAARWLRDSNCKAAWRGKLMKKLAELMQDEGQPLGLRGQAMAAFALSNDSNTGILFRQLCHEQSPELSQLAALGSGTIQDVKAVEELSSLLSSYSPNVYRAACLALTVIGTAPALEAVGYALLHGHEDLRRSAAEALANNHTEGYAMLREGSTMEDLLVRRSAAYGLGRVKQPWADEILTKMQVDDKEWAVRSAAIEVMESRSKPYAPIPTLPLPPSESPWLIEFAGKQGMGISPDKPATDLLLLALKNGTDEERIASLTYLRQTPNEGVLNSLYQVMYTDNTYLRDAVFQIIWELAASGVNLPDPLQYGVGQ